MQNTRDQAIVHDYAQASPEYGGMYRDGDVLVVLFTAHLAEHDRALRDLTAEPDLLTVAPAARSWDQVLAAADQVRSQLAIRPDVTSVGVTVADGAYVVTVGLDPYSDVASAAVLAACAPEPAHVRAVDAIRLLPARVGGERVAI